MNLQSTLATLTDTLVRSAFSAVRAALSTLLDAPLVGPLEVADGLVITAAGGLAVAAVTITTGRGRRYVRRKVHTRPWEQATAARLKAPAKVTRATKVPSGTQLDVTLPAGQHLGDLEAHTAGLAAALGVREIRVARNAANASRAHVTIVDHDPLAGPPLPWPHASAERLSLWQPVPVGVDENGRVVTMALPERNLLLGGEPGAGKSAALSLLVASAALDPTVKLWLLDGKGGVELVSWAGCAERFVRESVSDAIATLRELQGILSVRYDDLLAARRRKVEPGDGLPLHVVVMDELAHYFLAGTRAQNTECVQLARDLVSRGRAAGIIVLAATQKPAGDTVPTMVRDLFGFRWALRCSTTDASDTVLGRGMAGRGYSGADIDPSARGVGWLMAEGAQPVRLRSYWLDDAALAAVAARAEALRGPGESGVGGVPGLVGR